MLFLFMFLSNKVLYEVIVKMERKTTELQNIISMAKSRKLKYDYDKMLTTMVAETPSPQPTTSLGMGNNPHKDHHL